MELNETVGLMNSADYQERFKAEWLQLDIRTKSLRAMLDNWRNEMLEFEPTCSKELLTAQLASMIAYQSILEERARIENVELD